MDGRDMETRQEIWGGRSEKLSMCAKHSTGSSDDLNTLSQYAHHKWQLTSVAGGTGEPFVNSLNGY